MLESNSIGGASRNSRPPKKKSNRSESKEKFRLRSGPKRVFFFKFLGLAVRVHLLALEGFRPRHLGLSVRPLNDGSGRRFFVCFFFVFFCFGDPVRRRRVPKCANHLRGHL